MIEKKWLLILCSKNEMHRISKFYQFHYYSIYFNDFGVRKCILFEKNSIFKIKSIEFICQVQLMQWIFENIRNFYHNFYVKMKYIDEKKKHLICLIFIEMCLKSMLFLRNFAIQFKIYLAELIYLLSFMLINRMAP